MLQSVSNSSLPLLSLIQFLSSRILSHLDHCMYSFSNSSPTLFQCNPSNSTSVMFLSIIRWCISPADNFSVASHPLTGVQTLTYYTKPLIALNLPVFPVSFPTIPSYALYPMHAKQSALAHTAAKYRAGVQTQTVWF